MNETIVLPAGSKLDLGSGPRPKEGFLGVDIEPGMTDYQVSFDSGLPWPFEDDSVEELRASHVIEHIDASYRPEWTKVGRERDTAPPTSLETRVGKEIVRGGWRWQRTARRKDLLFHFFDEAFRVIKPGGKFEVCWPNVFHQNAHGDPTHRRQISELFYFYLSRDLRQYLGVSFYNVNCNWIGSCHLKRLACSEDDIDTEEFSRRVGREINVCEEIVMLLEAGK